MLIVCMIGFGAASDVLLAKGMKEVGAVSVSSVHVLGETLPQVFRNRVIWIGIGGLVLYLVAYMLALGSADFSYVLPASAASYAVVPVLGYSLLGESVSPLRWVGVVVICLGVVLVGRTPPNTARLGGADRPPARGAGPPSRSPDV